MSGDMRQSGSFIASIYAMRTYPTCFANGFDSDSAFWVSLTDVDCMYVRAGNGFRGECSAAERLSGCNPKEECTRYEFALFASELWAHGSRSRH